MTEYVKYEELPMLFIGERVRVNGTLYCVNREMPFLAHGLECTVASGWIGELEESWIGLETGVEDLDALELFISLDPQKIQPFVERK